MFNIDEYLGDIRIKEVSADEGLVHRTKRRCEETEERKHRHSLAMKHFKKAALIALPAAAVLALGIFIGARFFGAADQSDAVAYYTVDINPSICVNVGPEGVTDVVAQNEDAAALVGNLNVVGSPVGEAIRQIILSAQDAGYFADGERYVLIGCFTADGTIAQTALGDLQAQLEANFGDMIDLLIVSGTFEDKQMADALSVSAGLLKLSQLADGVEVTDGDKVEDVIDEVTQVNQANYSAPALKVTGDGQYVKLSWNEQDFDTMGFTGKVKYHIVTADTAAEVTEFAARTIKTIPFYTYGEQPTSVKLTLEECGIAAGDEQYFGIYAEYGGVMVAGSPVAYIVPGTEPSPIPTEPEPSESTLPSTGYTVSGQISGDNVVLSWDKETAKNFSGYKVVASRTNPTPSYPADGYLKYITNRDTTSISLYEGFGGLQGGVYYYFSITYLYQDGSTIAGNAVRLKVPDKDEAGSSETPSGDYVASTISGYVSEDGVIHLSWTEVSHSGFDGYKVMYSYTDSTPVYGESGCSYARWITNASTTSCTLTADDIGGSPGDTVYFSITVLYEGHTVKKAGNTITLTLVEGEKEEYASTTISGYVSEDGVIHLSWGEVSHSAFEGYKVMYSFTDSTPVYGESGCNYARWITNASTTSCTLTADEIGASPGQTVYFSITVLYNDETRQAGNSISLTMTTE